MKKFCILLTQCLPYDFHSKLCVYSYTTDTLYNHKSTGSVSDYVLMKVSIVLCYITMNLAAIMKCVKPTTTVLSLNTVAHSLTIQTWNLTVHILANSRINLIENLTFFFLVPYSRFRNNFVKQETASKCNIETIRCTYV
jgi:hypothetical protein